MNKSAGITLIFSLLVAGLVSLVAVSNPSNRPANIILISVDTLRADHLGAYGYRRNTSGFIDSIASRGAIFEDVVVPMPATDPSHATMMTGLHPLRTGLLSNATQLRDECETVAEVLRARGYATAAVTAVYHLAPGYGFGQGFDEFRSVERGVERRSAEAVNADAVRVIERHRRSDAGRPLFLFVHYFDVHAPYVNHERPEKFPADSSLESTIEAYDSGIRYVDAHIRALWTALQDAQLTNDSILIITSDHGEQLSEHGVTGGHADVYQETTRVPLVIAGAGIEPRRLSSAVSNMDLAPTLLQLVGRRFRANPDGRSLVPLLRGAPDHTPLEQQLLVLGYPSYTRSIALRLGRIFYVRNLEWVYRTAAIESLDIAGGVHAHARRAEASTVDNRRSFVIPPLDFEPYRITADLRATPGCLIELTISLPSGVDLVKHVKMRGPVRIRYSVARYDSSLIAVEPAACADDLVWSFEPESAPPDRVASTFERGEFPTVLFQALLTPRKHTPSDELFDVVNDPAMTVNILGSVNAPPASALRKLLRARFESSTRREQVPFVFTPDERRRLTSLGYVH